MTNKIEKRPWGSFEVIQESEKYKIKRLIVEKDEILSLQKHYHRSEHWVVVQGCAKVLVGEKEMILNKDQSVYIPIDTLHRLENVGKIPLIIIEVQSGDYLGEDDIIRFEDKYKRNE